MSYEAVLDRGPQIVKILSPHNWEIGIKARTKV